MTDTIHVPGFGTQKKTTVFIIGGLVVVVLGVGFYRARQNVAPSGPGIDSEVNPATGFAYGSAEDAAALSNQTGYIQPAYGGGTSEADTSSYTAGGFTSNSQWTQAAEDYLSNTVGHDSLSVGSALGHYLTGTPLSADEVSVVQQAIASQGYPPQSGPSGYPPSYRTVSAPPPAQSPKYDVLHPPKGTVYVADESNHHLIYEIWPTDGKARYINMSQYQALGAPKLKNVKLNLPKK